MKQKKIWLPPFLLIGFLSICGAESTLKIGRIVVNRKNVFETGSKLDQRFPYSWGNKLHIVTQESYIRNELLFREGDEIDPSKIEESERLLRRRPIFRYVKISPQEPVNGVTDVVVETEDVWTTSVHLAFGVAGGKTSYAFGVHEQNFLGFGKKVGAFIRKNIDRTTRGVSYADPQLFGTRFELFGGYGRDEKGREYETELKRPFYAVSIRHSEGISYLDRDDEDRLFENGEEVATFNHKRKELRIYAAYALRPSQKKIRRVMASHERITDEFADAKGPMAPTLPEERRLTPVLAGYEYQNIRYSKFRGVSTFDRDEDINMGFTLMAESGPSNKHFGATQKSWINRAMAGKNFTPAKNQVWLNHVIGQERIESGETQDGTLRFRSEYYLLDWLPFHTASLRGEHTVSQNLDPEREFLLGGENGLRGYSVRQFSGSNRTLFQLEDRRVVLYDWLHLVTIGWAAFIDTGAVWESGAFPGLSRFRSDIGAGLRFAPSRSVDPGLIRVDVAYALQENNRSSRFVLNIGADLQFGDKRERKFDQ